MSKKSIIETKTFAEGDFIYSHNDLSDFIYLIESGEVKILSKNDSFFKKFGECYISEIKPKKIKAWRYHKKNSQKIFLIEGKCKVILIKKKIIKKFILNSTNPSMLIIPKKTWYGYKFR